MCGVPDEHEGSEVVRSQDNDNSMKSRVHVSVVAEMLARVAAGYTTGTMGATPEDTAEFAKTVVESLLQFRT